MYINEYINIYIYTYIHTYIYSNIYQYRLDSKRDTDLGLRGDNRFGVGGCRFVVPIGLAPELVRVVLTVLYVVVNVLYVTVLCVAWSCLSCK